LQKRKPIKQKLSISVVLLLLINIWQWQRLQNMERFCKMESLAKIKHKKIKPHDIVHFYAHDLRKAKWENEHEFVLDGMIYDVLAVAYQNGQIVYQAYADKPEQQIMLTKAAFFNWGFGEAKNKVHWQMGPKSWTKTKALAMLHDKATAFKSSQKKQAYLPKSSIENQPKSYLLEVWMAVNGPPPERY
jgi:hypothetical protein